MLSKHYALTEVDECILYGLFQVRQMNYIAPA